MKRVLLLLFILLIPLKVEALSVSSVNISLPSEIKQWESTEINVDISFEGLSSNELVFSLGTGLDIEYDNTVLTVENIQALNSEIFLEGPVGTREILGLFDFEKNEVSLETNCSNNAFCNTYRFTFKIYPRVAGITNFTVRSPYIISGDFSKMPNFTEDDIKIIESTLEMTKSFNVIAAPNPTTTSKEHVEMTEKVTSSALNVPKVPTLPKTTTTISTASTSTSTQPILDQEQENSEVENNEKYEKMKKKLLFYGGIIIIIIILIIIIKLIINKIRDRKIDKVLKNL